MVAIETSSYFANIFRWFRQYLKSIKNYSNIYSWQAYNDCPHDSNSWSLHWFTKAAVTKYHKPCSLNNRNVLSHNSGVYKSKTKLQQD